MQRKFQPLSVKFVHTKCKNGLTWLPKWNRMPGIENHRYKRLLYLSLKYKQTINITSICIYIEVTKDPKYTKTVNNGQEQVSQKYIVTPQNKIKIFKFLRQGLTFSVTIWSHPYGHIHPRHCFSTPTSTFHMAMILHTHRHQSTPISTFQMAMRFCIPSTIPIAIFPLL